MQQDTNHFRLIACPSIISMEHGKVDRLQRPAGGSLADMLKSIDWARERQYTRVFLDGELIQDLSLIHI